MRCIFCKQPSASSVSVEHIIPEALGNEDHILPAGIVCDQCNNYFGRKIEGPLLDSGHFHGLRFRQSLPNKRGEVPPAFGLYPQGRVEVALKREKDSSLSIGPRFENDSDVFANAVRFNKTGSIWVPISDNIEPILLTRFLAKVGLEILAQRTLHLDVFEEEFIDNVQLDLLRDFARRGNKPTNWPIHERKIYPENHTFQGSKPHQILHEYTLLYTETRELYAVVCIMGVEYTINMGGPEIEGYLAWLKENNGLSPLYPDGINLLSAG